VWAASGGVGIDLDDLFCGAVSEGGLTTGASLSFAAFFFLAMTGAR